MVQMLIGSRECFVDEWLTQSPLSTTTNHIFNLYFVVSGSHFASREEVLAVRSVKASGKLHCESSCEIAQWG